MMRGAGGESGSASEDIDRMTEAVWAVPIVLGSKELVYRFWQALLEKGVSAPTLQLHGALDPCVLPTTASALCGTGTSRPMR